MMHITVPSFAKSSDFTHEIFNVYINGTYHCNVRYSAVHQLQKSIAQNVSPQVLARLCDFPPKHLLKNLSVQQLTERRLGLQKYLQSVVQSPATATHPLVLKFFLDSQVASYKSAPPLCSLSVLLPNGRAGCDIQCDVNKCSSAVLATVCQTLAMESNNVRRFALFVVENVGTRECNYIKWLQDYESPWVALQLLKDACTDSADNLRIIIQKCCWDTTIEQRLLDDSGAVKVLFAHAAWQVNTGLVEVPANVLQKLRALQQQQSCKQYVQLSQTQATYGYLHLSRCISDYPRPNTNVDVRVGQRKLVLSYIDPNTNEAATSVFRATRIRVWRIVSKADDSVTTMQFEFEYLLARDHFEWICLQTEQAALLSQCLQSIGSEIMGDRQSDAPVATTVAVVTNGSQSNATPSSTAGASTQSLTNTSTINSAYESLSQVLSRTKFTNGSTSNASTGVFDHITDDDL